jgi:hypothetical protein
MAYSGKWTPKRKEKYCGDYTKIKYRSLWERNTFRWLDAHPNVKRWSSEEVIINYRWQVDKKIHRYYVDLYIEWNNGDEVIVEIKPKKETAPPKMPKRKTKKYINEVTTYIKNSDKWKAANRYAQARGWRFEIWHEDILKNKGIKLLKG